MEPLAVQVGSDIVEDDRLFEGGGQRELSALIEEVAGTSDGDAATVLCSHGDVLPILLDLLVGAGMVPERNLVWQKASMWIVDRDGGAWGTGRYLPPPDRV